MNKKEEINLKKIKNIIENRKFDEYDIISFLIIIRPYLTSKKNPFIYDFANNIAHRKRDRGNALESITSAEINNYLLNDEGKVNNYNGISEENWNIEWKHISAKFNIKLTPIIISEITLCLFSLVQFSEFEYNINSIKDKPNLKKIKGKYELLIDDDSNLHLTTLGTKMVCYAKLINIQVEEKYKNKILFEPVETVRINKKLYLKYNNENILYVKRKIKTRVENT